MTNGHINIPKTYLLKIFEYQDWIPNNSDDHTSIQPFKMYKYEFKNEKKC